MKPVSNLNLKELEGRSFILGRQGHILIANAGAGRQHAEICIQQGKIYLRDLDSRNGLFLKKDGKLIKFKAGYVSLLQPVVIGDETYVVQDLLAIAHKFVCADDHTTMELPYWKGESSRVAELG